MQTDKIWQAVLSELQLQISKANYTTWLKDTRGISLTDGVLTIAVPTTFVAEWLTGRFSSMISRAFTSVTGQNARLQFIVQPIAEEPMRASSGVLPDGGVSLKARDKVAGLNSLNARYTFDNFVAGECNRLPYTAAVEVSANPGAAFNPLFIYGDTATGKTHLLHAIGHMLRKASVIVRCLSAEQFTNEFIVAIRNRKAEDFRQSFNNADVLLIDDIQFIRGKTQTQECLFHILNDFLDNNRQVVITGDRPPCNMESVNPRLVSRLEGGLMADLCPPDHTTRRSILEFKVQHLKSSFDQSVLDYIATNFHRNVRELEGAVLRLDTYSRLTNVRIDKKSASHILSDMVSQSGQAGNNHHPGAVIKAVAAHFNLTPDDITGKKRDMKTSRARHIAMYMLRQSNNYSLGEIGNLLGSRDHSTVIHGCEKIASSLATDQPLSKALDDIHKSLNSH